MSEIGTRVQVSAGGVAFRRAGDHIEVALISVGDPPRWQLPKGRVDEGETNEVTALREVREEAGIVTELIAPIDTIDYWFYARSRGDLTRIHKFVHFFLLRYLSGNIADHDREVHESRWFEISQAEEMLAFKSEKAMIAKARNMILGH